jgi:hypothetical protein
MSIKFTLLVRYNFLWLYDILTVVLQPIGAIGIHQGIFNRAWLRSSLVLCKNQKGKIF